MNYFAKIASMTFILTSTFAFSVSNDDFLCNKLEEKFEYCSTQKNIFKNFYNGTNQISHVCSRVKLNKDHCIDFLTLNETDCMLPCDPQSKTINWGFSGIAGMNDLKNQLYTDIINVIKDKKKAKDYGVSLPNGVLLYGPPGCGKTFIANKIAEELNFNFIEVKESTIGSPFIHATVIKIKEIFSNAEKLAPVIVFIDEVSSLLPDRSKISSSAHHLEGEVSEFLMELESAGQRGILVIGATNYPDKLDPAAIRSGRMDILMFIPPPDLQTRAELLKKEILKRKKVSISDNEIMLLANKTENYTSSDLKFLVEKTAKKALEYNSLIDFQKLYSMLLTTRPSLSNEEIEKYNKLKKFERR